MFEVETVKQVALLHVFIQSISLFFKGKTLNIREHQLPASLPFATSILIEIWCLPSAPARVLSVIQHLSEIKLDRIVIM